MVQAGPDTPDHAPKLQDAKQRAADGDLQQGTRHRKRLRACARHLRKRLELAFSGPAWRTLLPRDSVLNMILGIVSWFASAYCIAMFQEKVMRAFSLSRLSRRASLLALGVAGTVAISPRPLVARKKADFLCKRQVPQCETALTLFCQGPACPAQITCCANLANCNFAGFVTCANAAADPS